MSQHENEIANFEETANFSGFQIRIRTADRNYRPLMGWGWLPPSTTPPYLVSSPPLAKWQLVASKFFAFNVRPALIMLLLVLSAPGSDESSSTKRGLNAGGRVNSVGKKSAFRMVDRLLKKRQRRTKKSQEWKLRALRRLQKNQDGSCDSDEDRDSNGVEMVEAMGNNSDRSDGANIRQLIWKAANVFEEDMAVEQMGDEINPKYGFGRKKPRPKPPKQHPDVGLRQSAMKEIQSFFGIEQGEEGRKGKRSQSCDEGANCKERPEFFVNEDCLGSRKTFTNDNNTHNNDNDNSNSSRVGDEDEPAESRDYQRQGWPEPKGSRYRQDHKEEEEEEDEVIWGTEYGRRALPKARDKIPSFLEGFLFANSSVRWKKIYAFELKDIDHEHKFRKALFRTALRQPNLHNRGKALRKLKLSEEAAQLLERHFADEIARVVRGETGGEKGSRGNISRVLRLGFWHKRWKTLLRKKPKELCVSDVRASSAAYLMCCVSGLQLCQPLRDSLSMRRLRDGEIDCRLGWDTYVTYNVWLLLNIKPAYVTKRDPASFDDDDSCDNSGGDYSPLVDAPAPPPSHRQLLDDTATHESLEDALE
eukprot:jgi/Bigna1/77065/fgenesh1_pg.45_\